MTYEAMDRIIKHQVKLSLSERNLTVGDIGPDQYQRELYKQAIELLIALKPNR